MLSIIYQAVMSVGVLAALIFIHELGHFLFAKMNKVTVLEFAIGFGKVLWQKRIGDTKYCLRLIPLGGFVRMAGDDYNKYYADGEALVESVNPEEDPEARLERKIAHDRTKWFFAQNLWRRASIVFAGPLFNFILAWAILFTVFIVYGASSPVNRPIIGSLIPEFPAQMAGLKEGDFIYAVNNRKTSSWTELVTEIASAKGATVDLGVLRHSDLSIEKLDLKLTPKTESFEMQLIDGTVDKQPRYLIGIQPDLVKVSVTFKEAIEYSSNYLVGTSWLTLKSLYYMVTGQISAKNIGGPITIVQQAANSASKGFEVLLMFTVVISIGLAVLNLLPIPVLDGGHLLLFALEGLAGRRLNKKFMDYANQFGMVVLFSLMIFAIGNDIIRLVF